MDNAPPPGSPTDIPPRERLRRIIHSPNSTPEQKAQAKEDLQILDNAPKPIKMQKAAVNRDKDRRHNMAMMAKQRSSVNDDAPLSPDDQASIDRLFSGTRTKAYN
jgi:hypothetical protein